MYKYAIKAINTDLINCSTMIERDCVQGETVIYLRKWDTSPSISYFEEASSSIPLHVLPAEITRLYNEFEDRLIDYIKHNRGGSYK